MHLMPALPGQGLVLPAVAEVGEEHVALVVAEVAHLEREAQVHEFSCGETEAMDYSVPSGY